MNGGDMMKGVVYYGWDGGKDLGFYIKRE